MLTLEISGKTYPNLLDIQVTASLDRFARSFSFSMASNVFFNSPFGIGSLAIIKADGTPIVTGFIERISNSYNKSTHTVVVGGRSKTADLIDSTIGADLTFSGPVNLKIVAKKLVAALLRHPLIPSEFETPDTPAELFETPLSIDVVIENEVEDFLSNDILEEEIGQTYFSVLEKFARKRQVLLTDNGNGDIVITKGHGQTSGNPFFVLQNVTNGQNNNIISASRVDDDSQLFNLYDANSQPTFNIIKRIESIGADGLVTGNNFAIDDSIRESRKLVFITENPSTSAECQKRANWEANVRISRSIVYTAVTSGHSFKRGQISQLWEPNKPVLVKDIKTKINNNFLIEEVVYSQNKTDGSTTALKCLPSGAYNIEVPIQKMQKDIENIDFSELPIGPV